MSAEPGEFVHEGIVWTHDHYGPDDDLYQRECDAGCDRGLFYAPVRFCGRCDGSGFLVVTDDPRSARSGV